MEVSDLILWEDKTMKRWLVALVLALGLIVALPMYADFVPPFTPAPGAAVTPISVDPMTLGTVVASTGPVGFSFGGMHNNKNIGNVSETVLQTPASNLIFVFQVTVTGGTTGDITRISTGDWDNSIVIWALQYQDGGTVAATGVDRNGLGTVGINFMSPLVTKGLSSWEVVLYTNATVVEPGTIGLIDSGSNPSIPGYVGGLTTPEPATMTMLGLGLLALGALRNKNR